VIFDRSWYNRAGVERVMGFCTPEETERFLELVPGVDDRLSRTSQPQSRTKMR
jgi:polyphosphate kinase 2 (PPK2 family)